MVTTNLGSRSDIKKCLKEAFDAVEAGDYIEAKSSLDRLRFSIRIYYTTRGKSVENFEDLFEDATYTLHYATNNQHKKSLMEEVLDKITDTIRGEVPEDPNARLKALYEEIRHSYGSIGEENSASNIIDCFDEINALKEDFEENIYFSSMTQYMADSIALLIQVSKTERPPAALLAKLSEKFSDFFVSLQRVLVPPMRLPLTKGQIIENLQSGVSMKDISDGAGYSEVELRALLSDNNVDEDETREDYQ